MLFVEVGHIGSAMSHVEPTTRPWNASRFEPVDLPQNPRAMTARVNRVAEPLRKFRDIEIVKRAREWIISPTPVASDEDMAVCSRRSCFAVAALGWLIDLKCS